MIHHKPLNFKFFSPALFLLRCIVQCQGVAVESPEPASLLRPRDVNPHPYANVYDGITIFDKNLITNGEKFMKNLLNQGPIQFPRVANSIRAGNLPYPYEQLALKERGAKTERFSGVDNQIVKPAYRALAKHAARVLGNRLDSENYSAEDFDRYNEASTNLKKHYIFSYAVKDSASGDDFSHTQQQHTDGAVKGSYKVHLPDGRMQIVKYIADNNGYRADVTYENEPHNGNPVNSTPAPAGPLVTAQPVYSYYNQVPQRFPVRYQQATARPPLYYGPTVTPTQIPSPYYPTQLRATDVKIHSYNTAPHAGTLITSTASPATTGTYIYQPAANLAAYISTPTPNPVQIQANAAQSRQLVPVVLTTANPPLAGSYGDINVSPVVAAFPSATRRTSIFDNPGVAAPGTSYYQEQRPGGQPVTQQLNYGYVPVPSGNHVYRRNTDRSSEVLTELRSGAPESGSSGGARDQQKAAAQPSRQ